MITREHLIGYDDLQKTPLDVISKKMVSGGIQTNGTVHMLLLSQY